MAIVYCVTTTFYVVEKEEGTSIDSIPDEDWEVLHTEEIYTVDRVGFNPLIHLIVKMSAKIAGLEPAEILAQEEEEEAEE